MIPDHIKVLYSTEITLQSRYSPEMYITVSLPQVPPSQLVLFCNGKMLQGEDTITLRQARVCNGSKILASRYNLNKVTCTSIFR